ncbi:MAG: hypothetical protein LBK47_10905 [Prevotellaceae bacterium]|nr:hypothetical protein [Prevotellaceae bacterium]
MRLTSEQAIKSNAESCVYLELRYACTGLFTYYAYGMGRNFPELHSFDKLSMTTHAHR